MRKFLLAAFLAFVAVGAYGQPANLTNSVGFLRKETCITPTITAANAYGINFVVGGLLTFNNALGAGGTGALRAVTVNIKKVETSGFSFHLFTSNPSNSTWTDAAVANINAADVGFLRFSLGLTASSLLGTDTIAWWTGGSGFPYPIIKGNAGQTLYGILTTNAVLTNNFAAGDIANVCIATEID